MTKDHRLEVYVDAVLESSVAEILAAEKRSSGGNKGEECN